MMRGVHGSPLMAVSLASGFQEAQNPEPDQDHADNAHDPESKGEHLGTRPCFAPEERHLAPFSHARERALIADVGENKDRDANNNANE